MESPQAISVDPATSSECALLSDLLELYIHELSAIFPTVAIGPDGRFGYPALPLYWTEPERRFPFLIRCGGQIAGFVLVQRAALGPDTADAYDIAEFFVLRQYRRAAVGTRAAHLLWQRLVGPWTVRVAENNRNALGFWRAATATGPTGAVSEVRVMRGERPWIVLSFTTTTGVIHLPAASA